MTIMERFRQDYFKDFGRTYENHVNKFIEYIREVGKLDTPARINLNDVKECIGYYVEKGDTKAQGSMKSHLESVKSFYRYLMDNGKADDIFVQMNYEELKNELIEKYNLVEKQEREIFPMDIIKEILTQLDDILDVDYEKIGGINEPKRYSKYMILRVFIKIILIAPAKRQTIFDITSKNFDDDYRTVKINGIYVKVPNALRRDILVAMKHKNVEINKENRDKKFFHLLYGKDFGVGELNDWFCMFLKKTEILYLSKDKHSYALEVIMKTAINNMAERLANPYFISRINGTKIASIEKTYYKEKKENIEYSVSVENEINWEIAKCDYYNYI